MRTHITKRRVATARAQGLDLLMLVLMCCDLRVVAICGLLRCDLRVVI